jgi:hypothetical protein
LIDERLKYLCSSVRLCEVGNSSFIKRDEQRLKLLDARIAECTAFPADHQEFVAAKSIEEGIEALRLLKTGWQPIFNAIFTGLQCSDGAVTDERSCQQNSEHRSPW